MRLKVTGSPDGLGFSSRSRPKEGSPMVFKFFRGSFHSLKYIEIFLAVNAIVSWFMKLAAYFCQSLLITGRLYCQVIKVDWCGIPELALRGTIIIYCNAADAESPRRDLNCVYHPRSSYSSSPF
jgi:hypothetical protein